MNEMFDSRDKYLQEMELDCLKQFRHLSLHKYVPDIYYEFNSNFAPPGMDSIQPTYPFEKYLIPYLTRPRLVLKKNTLKPVEVEISHLGDFENSDNGKDMIVHLSGFTNPKGHKLEIFPFRMASNIICIVSVYRIKMSGSKEGRYYTGEDFFQKGNYKWDRIDKESAPVKKRSTQTETFKKMQKLFNE